MTKALLVVSGTLYWIVLHRYGWVYMGEATLLTTATALIGYWLRGMWEVARDETPNFYNGPRPVWTPWHILCFMAGGIVLEGVSRFLV